MPPRIAARPPVHARAGSEAASEDASSPSHDRDPRSPPARGQASRGQDCRPGGHGEGPNTRSHPELGRENPLRQWYCTSRCGRVGRRQARNPPLSFPFNRYSEQSEAAGWSSPVARQAHNLKVVGSNPTPATSVACSPSRPAVMGFLLSTLSAKIPARSPRSSIVSSPRSGTRRTSSMSARRASAASARSSGRFSSSCRRSARWR